MAVKTRFVKSIIRTAKSGAPALPWEKPTGRRVAEATPKATASKSRHA